MRRNPQAGFTGVEIQAELARALGKPRTGSTVREIWGKGKAPLLASGDLLVETEITARGARLVYRPVRDRLVVSLPFVPTSTGEFWGPSDVTCNQFRILMSPWRLPPDKVERGWREVVAWRKAHPEYRRKLADERRAAREHAAEERLARDLSRKWDWRPDSNGAISSDQVRAFYRSVRATLRSRSRRKGHATLPSPHSSTSQQASNRPRSASARRRRGRLAHADRRP